MNRPVVFVALLALIGCAAARAEGPPPAAAIDGASPSADRAAERRGAAYAQAQCAGCHAVGRTGDSPLAPAPPFRSLGLRYPVDDLAEAFAEGIDTAHPAMPEFILSPEENADLIAYLKSIQSPAPT